MILGIVLYLIGLMFSLTKTYYDIKTVGIGNYKISVTLIPDILLLLAIVSSAKNSWRRLSFIMASISVIYFDVVLAFNGKGSSILACQAIPVCDASMSITCGTLDIYQWTGVLYMIGMGIKILTSTYIARCIYAMPDSTKVNPDIAGMNNKGIL